MLCTMTRCLQGNGTRVVFHRDLYLVRCYFCYTSMIWLMHQIDIYSPLSADDSNMFITGKNPDDLVIKRNAEIVKVVDWLKINKLSLNLKKTHFIIFKKSQQKIHLENELLIDDIKNEMTSHTKF